MNNVNNMNTPFQNPIFNMFGNYQNFQNQFNQFANTFGQGNAINPQSMVQNMLNSGQMTQQQFNQFRMMANQITGKNY